MSKKQNPKNRATNEVKTHSKTLTIKQEMFCREYLIDLNATQAAIRSGYSEKTVNANVSRMMVDDGIQCRIQELMQEREKRTEITADNVLEEIRKIAFFDVRKLYDEDGHLKAVQDLDDETAKVVSSFKSRREYQGKDEEGNAEYATIEEYRTYDKAKHLEMLGKHLGIFEKDNSQSNKIIVKDINDFYDET